MKILSNYQQHKQTFTDFLSIYIQVSKTFVLQYPWNQFVNTEKWRHSNIYHFGYNETESLSSNKKYKKHKKWFFSGRTNAFCSMGFSFVLSPSQYHNVPQCIFKSSNSISSIVLEKKKNVKHNPNITFYQILKVSWKSDLKFKNCAIS